MSEHYSVEDKSLLVGPMKRFVWGPLLKLVPTTVSANAMTLAGTAINIAALTLAITVTPSRASMAAVAALVFAYLCIDNIDGAQARRTQTGSPLGEFLDHWLDGLNGTYLSLGAVVCWESQTMAGLLAVALTGVAYSITFWEQRTTGRMHFAVLGNVEGILLVTLLFAAQAVVGPHTLATTAVAFGASVTDIVVGMTIITTTLTITASIARVRKSLLELPGLLIGPAAIVAWYAWSSPPFVPTAALLVLITPATGGRMLASRVTKMPGLGPDYALILPIVLAAAACLALRPALDVERRVALALVAYAAAKVALELVVNIKRLARHIRPGELLSLFFAVERSSLSAPAEND